MYRLRREYECFPEVSISMNGDASFVAAAESTIARGISVFSGRESLMEDPPPSPEHGRSDGECMFSAVFRATQRLYKSCNLKELSVPLCGQPSSSGNMRGFRHTQVTIASPHSPDCCFSARKWVVSWDPTIVSPGRIGGPMGLIRQGCCSVLRL